MKLHHHPLSGHAHRAHLFLSLLNVPFDLENVDLASGAHKSDAYLKLNPLGQVPVLEDGDFVLADSNAILIYLARKFDRTDWLPTEPKAEAQVQRWLSIAAGQIASGPAAARLITVFGAPFNPEDTIKKAHAILAHVDASLDGKDWLVENGPTIADIALYSYINQAPEGNVDLSAYGKINNWLRRIEALPGFVPFTETKAGLKADAA